MIESTLNNQTQLDFTYEIYAGTTNYKEVVSTGNRVISGQSVIEARKDLIQWVHDNDVHCDERIDPLVLIISERIVIDCPICGGVGCNDYLCNNGKVHSDDLY